MATVGPERMVFDKAVLEHMQKATDKHETPAKEKHVRFVILASFKDRGATSFWNGASRLALQGDPVVCWKFCYMLHKTLRDGHPKCISESQPYSSRIFEIGKLWGNIREGYAQPIQAYTKVISKKISFHRKYPTLSGNLVISDAQLDGITHDDPNA